MKNGPKLDNRWNGVLYGTEDEVYAQMEDAGAPLFDYEAEVAVAGKLYPALIKSLGFKDPASILPAKEGGFKKI